MNEEIVCNQIKKVRLVKGITQHQIAGELNVSVPTYSRFERGKTKLNVQLLQEACKILEVDFKAVFLENEIDFFGGKKDFKTKETVLQDSINELNAKVDFVVQLLEKQQKENKVLLEKFKKN